MNQLDAQLSEEYLAHEFYRRSHSLYEELQARARVLNTLTEALMDLTQVQGFTNLQV